MVQRNRDYNTKYDGTLAIEQHRHHHIDVFYVPPETSLIAAGFDLQKSYDCRAKLLEINFQENDLTIHPINTFDTNQDFLCPKYKQVKRITLKNLINDLTDFENPKNTTREDIIELLEELPPAFTKNYSYGLGLAKPYRFIIDAIEELSDCTEIVISKKCTTGLSTNKENFLIAYEDFKILRHSMDNIGNLANVAVRTVRSTEAYNILSEHLGATKRKPNFGRHPYRKLFTNYISDKEGLSEKDENNLLNTISQNTKNLIENQPEKFAKLRSDIELATLEKLIEFYEEMLDKKLRESKWQDFFNNNPFILNMAFGYPIIIVSEQAHMGGQKLSGYGEKITDFLVKNSLTNNTAIFEIKTPQTNVLNKKPYRDSVFIPSSDLSGSINQVLDQKYKFQKQFAQIKDNTRIYDIESYAVHCCLVIGKTPKEEDEKKSFELFRHNSKDVQVITFDELLEKLKQLSSFLRSNNREDG